MDAFLFPSIVAYLSVSSLSSFHLRWMLRTEAPFLFRSIYIVSFHPRSLSFSLHAEVPFPLFFFSFVTDLCIVPRLMAHLV